MERGIAEQDFHEIEMLLGEIPNATSGNHLRVQTSLTGSSQRLETASKDAKLYNFHQPATDQGRNSSNGGVKLQSKVSTGYEFSEEIHIDDTNLQDERSLPLLLEGMSIKESPSPKPVSPASVLNKQNSLNHTFLPNKQFINHQDKFLHGYDHIDMNFPQPGSLNGINSSNIVLEMRSPSKRFNELISLTDQNESNQASESLLGNFAEYPQVFQMNTMDMPLNSCSNSYQLLPNGQELQLPNLFQPNYCADSPSPPMRITQPSLVWHGLEEERYGRSHQQCLHPQHLQNQRPEFLQFRRNIDCGISPFNRNNVQPCFEFTVPQQFERCKGPFLNANTIYDRSNMINYCHYQSHESSGRVENCWSSHEQKVLSGNSVSCSTKDFHGHQSFDKVGNKCFPQKILTRTHGVNSVRVLRPNAYTTDQPLLFDENSFRWSNGNAHQHCRLNNGSLQLNNRSNNGSCHENFNSGLVSKSIQKRYSSVDEVAGRICLMAKDQHGCRFLQRKFSEGSREEIDKIFSEIILQIVELMTDPFGNYLVQKLLEVCNEEQMMLILKIITRNTNELVRISCDMHGTRALQKVIETVRTPEQIFIVVSSLEPCIIPMMKHINGNHVAQRCMQYLSNYSELLVDAVITHCFELATDRQGCCVLQKCLAHAGENQKQMLIAEISAHSLILSKDQFGNYAVQFVLDLKDPWATSVVLEQLTGNYEHLSIQKYSSNVVERCLKLAGENHLVKIIQELMGSPLLPQILQDPYGNYVMQTALNVSKVRVDLHVNLLEAVVSHTFALRSSPYGKKVLSTALLMLKK